MITRGEVDPHAPAQRYAPLGLTLPTRDGREITLLDLATHRSGLPRLPGNLVRDDRTNPYAQYGIAQLYEFLATYELPRAIGSQYEYSNLGMGLLGHLLGARAGMDYETLVTARILGPLGMTMTGVTLSKAMTTHLAIGHNAQGQPTGLWDLPTLAGAGALRSNVENMLTFLGANVRESQTDLGRAIRTSHQSVSSSHGMEVGLGWHIVPWGSSTIVFHTGGTGGYRSAIYIDPSRGRGFVILTNGVQDVDELALRMMSGDVSPTAIVNSGGVHLPPEVLSGYLGEYAYLATFTQKATIRVTLDDGVLVFESSGAFKVKTIAESATTFVDPIQDLRFTFVADLEGEVSGLNLRFARFSRSAKRVR
jgi:CubicO group peptidase (beta-lactamase class C family)